MVVSNVSGILPRLGNGISYMSRAIYVNLWLEERFAFKKQWELFWRQKECFQNDGHMLSRQGTARFAMGIEEGIQPFSGWSRVERF